MTGSIKNVLARKTITPNFEATVSNDSLVIQQSGNVVSINGSIKIKNSAIAGSGATVFTLPEGSRPSSLVIIKAQATYGTTSGFWNFAINTNGEVFTSTGSSTYPANSFIGFASVTFIAN